VPFQSLLDTGGQTSLREVDQQRDTRATSLRKVDQQRDPRATSLREVDQQRDPRATSLRETDPWREHAIPPGEYDIPIDESFGGDILQGTEIASFLIFA
jgi:hypothetical protein